MALAMAMAMAMALAMALATAMAMTSNPNEYLFYSYDLCRDGMRVGVFYDEDRVSKEEVNAFISTLRRKQDVAFLRKNSLKLYTQKGE
ncbi:MAG: hypothetical protein LHW56_01910 [Candidatus Cloacimonetes bacterium]|nr:hypothetical protein [Candidatus Cloacimonadota bacterium]MDY0171642.1 hypothetical protein [Candidatus Cloacimonadaceae bacterium]